MTVRKFDLDDTDSKCEFRADLTYARKSRRSWDKVGATAIGAIATTLVSGVTALIMRYVSSEGWNRGPPCRCSGGARRPPSSAA